MESIWYPSCAIALKRQGTVSCISRAFQSSRGSKIYLGHLDVLGCPVFLSCMACHAPFGSVRSSLLFRLGVMVKGALVRSKGEAKAH